MIGKIIHSSLSPNIYIVVIGRMQLNSLATISLISDNYEDNCMTLQVIRSTGSSTQLTCLITLDPTSSVKYCNCSQ